MSTQCAADLHRYLQDGRDRIVASIEGLDEYDSRRPMTPTATNLLGLIKHLTGNELSYLGDSVGRPSPVTLPWVADGSIWDGADMWATAQESRGELVGLYRTAWRHTDESVERLGLDAPAHVAWWADGKRDTTLGSLLVRLTAETAQHAGHADILRELIDGHLGTTSGDPADDTQWRARHYERVRRAADRYRRDAPGS